ncbi:MAG: aminoacetone oxidase family FAD-binding enzyme [Candidatus Aureabacteria bacterium]|nr:aminoacetone oxidase family FAD-binding enzyme [Candidatus Auribacterota bacterium]
MKRYFLAIIGGGAAGLVAAISAARKGRGVIILERMPRPGKKLLISGNGRCNLTNETLALEMYNPHARALVGQVLGSFGGDAILRFFRELGIRVYAKGTRVFPVTNQAASVLSVLEIELSRLGVPVECGFEVKSIDVGADGFVVNSHNGARVAADRVLLAAGGKSYPALGSDGSGYDLARRFGHHVVEPVPSGVPLVTKDRLCQMVQGQRIAVRARSIINGRMCAQAEGDLLFAQYGISGTAILDISEEISIALHRDHLKEVTVAIDLVPFITREELRRELAGRAERGWGGGQLLVGLLPNKFGAALKDLSRGRDSAAMISGLKDRRFTITGTRGWNEAEFTSGGVKVTEVNPRTLESTRQRGLYFAGEILDVTGKRGGYNLAWAWASGYIAGQA